MQNNKLKPWLYIDSHGRINVNRQKLYKHIKNQHVFYVSDKGQIYTYTDGYYKLLSRRQVFNFIKGYIPAEIRNKLDWQTVAEELYTDSPDFYEKDLNQDENIIVFNNGVLHLDTGKFMKHSPKYLVTRKVDQDYIPDAKLEGAPTFEAFIYGLAEDGDEHFPAVRLILEFIGAVLSNVKGWRFKKMLIIIGPGNTGKSKIRELIMSLVGIENCISIDLKRINERFGTGALFGKRLAGSGDMSFMQLKEMDTIKELTGGDMLMAEFKGKDIFSFVYDGYIFCTANKLPFFRGDRGEHVYERFLIIECGNPVPKEKQDRKLLDKFLQEKDVIASVAIKHLMKAIQRGYVFTESDAMIQARKEYCRDNNSLLSFVDECCSRGESDNMLRSEFKRMYKIWCRINNMQPERDRDIGKQLEDFYGITAKKVTGYYRYPLHIQADIQLELDAAIKDTKDGAR